MSQPYKAVERTYLTADKQYTRGPVYHPAIKLPDDKTFCFFPDETTESGLIEYDNSEDALVYAIKLYQHHMKARSETNASDSHRNVIHER